MPGESGGFWNAIASAAIPSATNFVTQLFTNSANKEAKEDERAYNKQQSDLKFQQEKDLLAFKAGLGGAGGGGGGGGPFTGFTDPQKVQALQSQNQIELDAINQIIAAYQRAVLPR